MSTETAPKFKNFDIINVILTTKIRIFINILIYTTLIPALLYGLLLITVNYQNKIVSTQQLMAQNNSKPIYWIYYRGTDESHLKHVFIILEKLGFTRGTNKSDWDLLWAHDYPYRSIGGNLKKLKSHQKINHLPGCGYITNKVDLSTIEGNKYIPPSFRIPEDNVSLLNYINDNPYKKFVQKSNAHRGISIKETNNINFNEIGTFVQEYIEKPYLIDGFKFDIGVYTVITSVDPLRLYVYKGDVLFRFCPVKYYPFDPMNLDKYVVGDDYLPIWNVPSLRNYYIKMGFSMKDTFDAYIRTKQQDPDKIWDDINNAIRIIVLKKEKQIANVVRQFGSGRNFFEMVRFDFVLDEQLNVFIMEANMSPNLSSAHYPPNRLLYEQVLFNLFALLGIGQRIDPAYRRPRNWQEQEIQVADKNLVVLPEICLACDDCFRVECLLCKPCFTDEMRLILTQSYIEQQNRMDYKRIFPPAITANMTLKDYTMKNQLLVRWYQGKCANDPTWCN